MLVNTFPDVTTTDLARVVLALTDEQTAALRALLTSQGEVPLLTEDGPVAPAGLRLVLEWSPTEA